MKLIEKFESYDQALSKTFKFSNFKNAFKFCEKLAAHSEKVQHHPKLIIDYNNVKVICYTHDNKKVTDKDRDLIKAAADLYQKSAK